MYIKGGGNVFNTEGKLNGMGQCWFIPDLLDFSIKVPVGGYLMQIYVA